MQTHYRALVVYSMEEDALVNEGKWNTQSGNVRVGGRVFSVTSEDSGGRKPQDHFI